jgi:hypothetical protein
MAEARTTPTTAQVSDFIRSIDDDQKRADSERLVGLLGEITGQPAVMWGPSIVGFGHHHYRYASGREGDTFILGFSPRKANLTLYLPGYLERYQDLLGMLGKHSVGKGCLYVKRLADVDPKVLRQLLQTASSERG